MVERDASHAYRWSAMATSLTLLFLSCSLPMRFTPTPMPNATPTAWEQRRTPTPACPRLMDETTLTSLAFSAAPSIQMRSGETKAIALGVVEYPMFREVEACVVWSVAPEEGATITQDGELTIDPSVPHGSIFTVTADIENGRRLMSIDVYVYDPAQNPLVGGWREEAQIACGSQEEVAPGEPILSLVFYADGRMTVTWFPFETYIDYSGVYSVSPDGSIELAITWSAYAPAT